MSEQTIDKLVRVTEAQWYKPEEENNAWLASQIVARLAMMHLVKDQAKIGDLRREVLDVLNNQQPIENWG